MKTLTCMRNVMMVFVISIFSIGIIALAAGLPTTQEARNARDAMLAKLPLKGAVIPAKALAMYFAGFELLDAYGCAKDVDVDYWTGGAAPTNGGESIYSLMAERADVVATYAGAYCRNGRFNVSEQGLPPQADRLEAQLHDFNQLYNPHLYDANGNPLTYDPSPELTIPLFFYIASTGGLAITQMDTNPVNLVFVSNHASALGGTELAALGEAASWVMDLFGGSWPGSSRAMLQDLEDATSQPMGHKAMTRVDGQGASILSVHYSGIVWDSRNIFTPNDNDSLYHTGDGIDGTSTTVLHATSYFCNQPCDGFLPAHSFTAQTGSYNYSEGYYTHNCHEDDKCEKFQEQLFVYDKQESAQFHDIPWYKSGDDYYTYSYYNQERNGTSSIPGTEFVFFNNLKPGENGNKYIGWFDWQYHNYDTRQQQLYGFTQTNMVNHGSVSYAPEVEVMSMNRLGQLIDASPHL